MIRNIITTASLLLAAFSIGSCQDSTAQNTFAVHAEIMGATAEQPTIKAAPNVTIGEKSVYAFYNDAEFILQYCGKLYVERGGKQEEPRNAKVFQLEPGVWLAELEGGDYVKVFTTSGNTNMDVDGEFRTFAKN